jgi:hypothetical protein
MGIASTTLSSQLLGISFSRAWDNGIATATAISVRDDTDTGTSATEIRRSSDAAAVRMRRGLEAREYPETALAVGEVEAEAEAQTEAQAADRDSSMSSRLQRVLAVELVLLLPVLGLALPDKECELELN